MKLSSKIFLLFSVLLLIAVVSFGTYYSFKSRQPTAISQVPTGTTTTLALSSHGPCLADYEYADFPSPNKDIPVPTLAATTTLVISVYDKTSGQKTSGFEIPNVSTNYHSLELRHCGAYVIREFNYNRKNGGHYIGYRQELWLYAYDGQKKLLILLAEKPKEFIAYYNPEFRIDSKESYIALTRGYLGKDDYAIVIKDLKTLKDAFVLPVQEIEKQNPDLVADIEFHNDWTKDGRYFWAKTHDGANTVAFIRIDMQTKAFDLLPAPKDVLGGDALNIEKGLITVHPGNVWYGIADITEQEKAKRRAQGISTELYIYNLFTNEKDFVVSTTEPLYYFKPKWLSDTEFQYTLPSGETKIYKVE